MTDDAFAAMLAATTATAQGQIKLTHFAPVFTHVADAHEDPATRPVAALMMKDWAEGEDPLHKALAQHWLDRSHAIVEHGMAAGKEVAAVAVAAKRKIHPVFVKILASKRAPAAKPVA